MTDGLHTYTHQPAAPLPWMDRRECSPETAHLFYPDAGATAARYIADAVRLCGRCAVSAECLAYALQHNEAHGVWGGTTPEDRRRLRRIR